MNEPQSIIARCDPFGHWSAHFADQPWLEFGVPDRLWATDILPEILPVEDHDLLDAANPIDEDGQYREVDEKAWEAREDFMVRTMLKRGGVSVIVLGSGHNLGDNVRRIAAGDCEYLRLVGDGYVCVSE